MVLMAVSTRAVVSNPSKHYFVLWLSNSYGIIRDAISPDRQNSKETSVLLIS